jgi:putative polymerase
MQIGTSSDIAEVYETRPDPRLYDRTAFFIVLLALFQNIVLAAVNNVYSINAGIVTITQLIITAGAVAMLFFRRQALNEEAAAAFVAIILLFVVAGFVSTKMNLRAIYDVFVIPVFMMLGLRVKKFPLSGIYILIAIVLVVALLDSIFPDTYIALFNPQKYYLNTRIWLADAADSTTSDLGLYVGATRASNNVLDFLGADHRAGSIFLEPLSLGYFATISLIGILFAGRGISKYVGLSACLILTILADSRTGFAASLFLIAIFPFIRRIPVSFILGFPVIGFFLLFLVYKFAGPQGDLGYRLSVTFDPLGKALVSDLILGGLNTDEIQDSGFIYLIANFGLLGAALAILLNSGVLITRFSDVRIPTAAIIYIFFSATFGAALFSIKTASLLGFILGTAASGALRRRPSSAEKALELSVSHPVPKRGLIPT